MSWEPGIWSSPAFWSAEAELWAKLEALDPRVAAKLRRDPETGCWLWTGAVTPSARCSTGYGRVQRPLSEQGTPYRERKAWGVHRWTYHLLVAPFPATHEVHHWCCRKLCANPLHGEPMDPEEHSRLEIDLCEGGFIFEAPPQTFVHVSEDTDLPF